MRRVLTIEVTDDSLTDNQVVEIIQNGIRSGLSLRYRERHPEVYNRDLTDAEWNAALEGWTLTGILMHWRNNG